MNVLKSVDELRKLHKRLSVSGKDLVQIRVCSTGCRALGA